MNKLDRSKLILNRGTPWRRFSNEEYMEECIAFALLAGAEWSCGTEVANAAHIKSLRCNAFDHTYGDGIKMTLIQKDSVATWVQIVHWDEFIVALSGGQDA